MWLAIPAYKLTCQFTIRKGRSWREDEESIFRSIAKAPATIGMLTIQSPASRPRVLASLDRMMRYGLVASSLAHGRLEYRATPEGEARVAEGRPLPFFPKLETRRISFVVERATLRSFLTREVPLVPAVQLDELGRGDTEVRRVPVKRGGRDGPITEEQFERLRAFAVRARDELVVRTHVVESPTPEDGFIVVAADSALHLPRDAGEELRSLLADVAATAPRRHARTAKRH